MTILDVKGAPRVRGERPVLAADFKATMRQHAGGVAIVTTGTPCAADGLIPSGFCATSLVSLSLRPPMVSFAVAHGSRSCRAWQTTNRGVVHLLHEGQASLARAFADPGADRFGPSIGWGWSWGADAAPVLDDVQAWLTVRATTRLEAGDHLLVICDVVATRVAAQSRRPLVYHDGDFAPLSATLR